MKRYFIFILTFLTIGLVKSQSSEIGICAGTSFYLGDLNPKGLFQGSRFAGGLLFRYNINPRFAFKATALFGGLYADDAKTGTTERNLNFRSNLSELSAQMEINFLKLYNEQGKNCISPYLFAGISVFAFNPQSEYNGKWYDLQALGTEGQGLNQTDSYGNTYDKKRYSLTNVAIPFGIGIRINFLQYYCIGVEWGFRYTFTDYLDDVGGYYVDRDLLIEYRSQLIADLSDRTTAVTTDSEGNSIPDYHKAGTARKTNNANDWYSFLTLNFSFKISDVIKNCSSPLRSKNTKHLPKRK